ncbi:energy-coupling factor ABC transporter ATP-binding protein [Desulfosoma sp.]
MIEAVDVGFTYPDGTEALRGLSFRIPCPAFVLLCGANGQGKSTLLYLLAGLYPPTRGTLTVFGMDVARRPEAVRPCVGLVFQDPDSQILGETVADDVAFGPENLALPIRERERRVAQSLAFFGLKEVAEKPCYALSGGQKRRVALAGVLAMDPQVVLFDEPFTHLDWDGACALLRGMNRLRDEGRTVVVSTHDVEKVIAHVDRVLVLREGTLVRSGPPQEVAFELGRYGVRPPCSVLLGKGLMPWPCD